MRQSEGGLNVEKKPHRQYLFLAGQSYRPVLVPTGRIGNVCKRRVGATANPLNRRQHCDSNEAQNQRVFDGGEAIVIVEKRASMSDRSHIQGYSGGIACQMREVRPRWLCCDRENVSRPWSATPSEPFSQRMPFVLTIEVHASAGGGYVAHALLQEGSDQQGGEFALRFVASLAQPSPNAQVSATEPSRSPLGKCNKICTRQ